MGVRTSKKQWPSGGWKLVWTDGKERNRRRRGIEAKERRPESRVPEKRETRQTGVLESTPESLGCQEEGFEIHAEGTESCLQEHGAYARSVSCR